MNPTVHRKGVGCALFKHAQDKVAEAGHPALKVNTAASAVPFYFAMGMARTGLWSPEAGPFCGAELIVLEKPVVPQQLNNRRPKKPHS